MNKNTYIIDYKKNILKINAKLGNFEDGIKIYFSRGVDEFATTDKPVCYTDSYKNKNVYEWIDGYYIIDVMIKKPKFFGLTYEWIFLEEI